MSDWIRRYDFLPTEIQEMIEFYCQRNIELDKKNHKKKLQNVHTLLREVHLNKGIYLLENSLFTREDKLKNLPLHFIHVESDDYALYFRDDLGVTWVVCRFTRKKYKSVHFAGMQRLLYV